MSKRLPFNEEELKEFKLVEHMSYDEMVDHFSKKALTESTSIPIRELDMTLEEFQNTYDCVDMSQFLGSYGLKIFDKNA